MTTEINMESLLLFCDLHKTTLNEMVKLAQADNRVSNLIETRHQAHTKGTAKAQRAFEKAQKGVNDKTRIDSDKFRSFFISGNYPEIEGDFLRLARNKSKKTTNIRAHIEKMAKNKMGGKRYFVTLTWTDEVFRTTSAETRRRYVNRALSNFMDFDANIDYGSKNGREHYHAVVLTDGDPNALLQDYADKYGFVNVQEIPNDAPALRIARYENKLANHATKVSGRRLTPKMSDWRKIDLYGYENFDKDYLPF